VIAPEAWEVQAEIAAGRGRGEDDRQLTARIMALLPAEGHSGIVGPGMKDIIETVDAWLDGPALAEPYRKQPLAQHWARVAKLAEELGELHEAAGHTELSAASQKRLAGCTMAIGRAVSALIACTGQNPRKGISGTTDEMLDELADVVCCGMFAIQHFTKNAELTADFVATALVKALNRATGATREPAGENCPVGHVRPVAGCTWCEENIDPVTWRERWAQGH
jgi:NTP pyrophosphatase (non-canonical NTP hydrolase)